MEELVDRDSVHGRPNNYLLSGAPRVSTVWAYLNFSKDYLYNMRQTEIEYA